jgi:hypothetical protein
MTIRLYGKESQDSHSHNKRKVKKVTVIIKGKCPGLGQAQQHGRVKLINVLSILPV